MNFHEATDHAIGDFSKQTDTQYSKLTYQLKFLQSNFDSHDDVVVSPQPTFTTSPIV